MKKFQILAAGFIAMFGFSHHLVSAPSRLEARIVDDVTGKSLAARVAITTPDGKFVEIKGKHPHVDYLGKRWCYVDGAFSLPLPVSAVQIEIRRGLETRPEIATITGGGAGKPIEKTFRLRRWIDMRQKGYFNGDAHAHLPIPAEAHFQMLAEDLNTLTLLHVADPRIPPAVNECFTGKLDKVSTPDCQIYVSQEIRDWQMGHVTLIGLTNLIPGYPNAGGTLEYWESHPHIDLMPAIRATHAQGGMVLWSHVCSLPGAQLPIAIALGQVDGIELITWNDPTKFPNHWGPWQDSGMSQAEFPIMRTLDLYYTHLNAGFRLPIAAGTDKFVEDIPLGSNRVYVQAKEPANYASWLAGIKAGRGFVSNGPILEFDAGEQMPGDIMEFRGAKRVKAQVKARSILPFTTLEIVMNGKTVGHKTLPNDKHPPVDGLYSMEVEATVEFNQSGWLAARVIEHPDLKNPILPRGLSVFAHTNPVYFLQDGRKVREEASIAYLRKYVEGTLHWLGTKPQFVSDADLNRSIREAQEALDFYKKL